MHRSRRNVRQRRTASFGFNLLEPRYLLAGDIICTGDMDNVIVASVSAADPTVIEIEVDGVLNSTFDIASTDVISINAELGNDLFLLDYSNGTPVNAGGYEFHGGAGVDTLESNNATANFFVFELQADSDGTLGEFLTFNSVEELIGGAGADRFDVRSIDHEIRVDGQGGNDVFRLGTTAPDFFNGVLTGLDGEILIEGGSGQNRILLGGRGGGQLDLLIHDSFIVGHNGQFSINFVSTGGSFTNSDGSIGGITVFGSNFAQDVFTVSSFFESNTLKLRGSFGNDIFRVSAQALGDVELDGGTGANISQVNFVGSGSRRVFVTSVDSSSNSLTAIGTEGDDQFETVGRDVISGAEILSSDESIVLAGADGDDTFLIGSDLDRRYQGNSGNDVFVTTQTLERINIFAGLGNDEIDITESPNSGSIFGGEGDDVFRGRNNQVGNLRVYGQSGSDTYQLEIFSAPEFFRFDVRDTGPEDGDIDVYDFTFTEEVVANTTDLELEFFIPDVSFVNSILTNGAERLTINTGDADDTVTVGGTVDTFVNTGGGDDEIIVGGLGTSAGDFRSGGHVEINGGAGFNQLGLGNRRVDSPLVRFDVDDSGATTIEGGNENVFTVRATSPGGVFNTVDNSRGIYVEGVNLGSTQDFVIIDGLLAENSFELSGVRRTFNIGAGALGDFSTGLLQLSVVEIQESGTDRVIDLVPSDNDSLANTVNIVGSVAAEEFVVANNFSSWGSVEQVMFDATTIDFNVIGFDGDDSFEIIATLVGVRTSLFGGNGNDSFVLGGNLNSLDGAVAVFGGTGVDSLLVDDSEALSAYSYQVDNNRIFSIPGPANAARPDFVGITFGNAQLENLTLQASVGNNLVRVRPTSTTDINLIGGTGGNAVDLITVPFDGHVLELDDEASGRWTFDFEFRDLVFAGFDIQAES